MTVLKKVQQILTILQLHKTGNTIDNISGSSFSEPSHPQRKTTYVICDCICLLYCKIILM